MTVGNDPTIHFALDGQNVAQEGHLDQGNFVADVTYLNGPRGVEYREDSNGKKWYLYDGLGSVVAEVDADGDVTSTTKYDIYGSIRGSTGASDSQHKFVGKLGHTTEPDTGGLIYMRARWCDPVTGRFISEDTARDGFNWFAYCGLNPVNATDFTGCVYGFDDALNEDAEWGMQAVKTGKDVTWNIKRIFNVVRQETGMSRETFSKLLHQSVKKGLRGDTNIGLITKGEKAGHLITSTGQDLGHWIDYFCFGGL